MTVSDQSPAASRDLDAIVTQTQAAALRLLEPAALTGLQRELRAMKEVAADEPMRKTLAKAVQRIAAEKRRRAGAEADAAAAGAPADPAPAPAGTDKAGRAEKKRLKEADQAEKKRVREAEKSERQAARKAEKQAARKAAKLAGQDGDMPAKPAGAGAAAGSGPKGSGKPGKARGQKAE